MPVDESEMQCIDCGEVMDIAGAVELRAHLLDTLEAQQMVTLDASQVERADTAALQVLAAFIKDAISQQQVVQWRNPTVALCDSAALIGMTELLQLQTDSR